MHKYAEQMTAKKLPMVEDIRDEAEIIGTDGKPLAGYEAIILRITVA